jgi:hypothetical protein
MHNIELLTNPTLWINDIIPLQCETTNTHARTHTLIWEKNLGCLSGDFSDMHSGNNRLWFPLDSEYLQQIFFSDFRWKCLDKT